MLTEHFIASVGLANKTPAPGIAKDAAIFLYEFQPLRQQRQLLKKSATAPNCLAISSTHIFAAQVDKGVIHVYGRAKGNQEATVPFTDKISSIALICDDLVLAIGTVAGRIFLWELASGRQISTLQSHLQAVTVLAADSTQNFLLSGSKDSTVNVWSIPSLLSFARTADAAPLRSLSNHRDEVVSVVLGHSSSTYNFAISTSIDRTALVWDYRTGVVLRTYLLPAAPLCLSLDPADRAAYVGYDDGTIQLLDLYVSPEGRRQALQNGQYATEPLQPAELSRWKLHESKHGAVTSLSVSFDGTILLSGHQSGAVLSWDVARGSFISVLTQIDLPGPVNNLYFLPVSGFTGERDKTRAKISEITKPKFGAFNSTEDASTPGNYALNIEFPCDLSMTESMSDSVIALTTPSFSTTLLDQGLSEIALWSQRSGSSQPTDEVGSRSEDYVALDDPVSSTGMESLQSENRNLKQQLEALRRVQKKTFEKMDLLSEEKEALLKREHVRLARRGAGMNGTAAGPDEDTDFTDGD